MKSTEPRSIGEKHPLTRAVEERFLRAAEGDIVAYPELWEVLGLDPQSERGRRYINSAQRILRRSHKIIVDVVPNVGYKRLGDEGAVAVSGAYIKRAGNRAKVSHETLRSIREPGSLPPDALRDYRVNLSLSGVMRAVLSPTVRTRMIALGEKLNTEALRDNLMRSLRPPRDAE